MAKRWDHLRRIFVDEFDASLYLLRSERGQPNGVASLGPDGIVPEDELPPGFGGGGGTVVAGPLITNGLQFEYISQTSVRLVPSGLGGTARVATMNDSGDFLYVSLESALVWNTTSGFQPGTSKLTNAGYEIFLEVRSDGTGARLSAARNENPRLNSTGYSFKSGVIGFVSIDSSGLIRPFANVGMDWWYVQDYSISLFAGVTSTVHQNLDLSQYIPTVAAAAYVRTSWQNQSTTSKDFMVFSKTPFGSFVRAAGGPTQDEAGNRYELNEIPLLNTPSHAVDYSWDIVPSGTFGGAAMYMIGFRMRVSIGLSGGAGETDGGGDVVQITAGTDLDSTPDPITGIGTINHANSGVTAGTFGSTTLIPVITVNARGHITAAAQVAAAGGGGGGGGTVTAVTGTAPISSTGGTTPDISLDDDGVTNTKLANMAAGTVKGRAIGAGTGDPQDLTQGTGGGLDVDKVDGLHGTQFLRSDASNLGYAHTIEFDGGTLHMKAGSATNIDGNFDATGATTFGLPAFNISGAGSGSDLDADFLDGVDSAQFLRSDTNDTFNGPTLTFDGSTAYFQTDATLEVAGTLELGGAISTHMPEANITGAGSGSGLDADLIDGIDSSELVLLQGLSGQHITGGSLAGNDLTLESTSNATKGDVIIQPNGGGVDFSGVNSQIAFPALAGTFTGAGTGSGLDADKLDGHHASDFVTTATDTELAQDAVGTILTDTATIDFTYTDATPSITADVKNDSIDNTKLANMANATIKGRSTAGTGDPEDLTAAQVADLIGDAISAFTSLAPSGCKITRNTAAQLQLVPSGIDGKARVVLYDGSALQSFTVTSTKTADITTSGAGGLDTGSEAASTFYYLWAIGKSDGTFNLLLSTSVSSPTMPSGYTFKRLLGGDRNDGSSDFCVFDHTKDGWFRYRIANVMSGGISILSGGSSTTDVALDFTGTVPDITGIHVEVMFDPTNSNVSAGQSCSARLKFANANANDIIIQQPLGGGGFTQTIRTRERITLHSGLATSAYYQWSANLGTRSLNVLTCGFNMGLTW